MENLDTNLEGFCIWIKHLAFSLTTKEHKINNKRESYYHFDN